MLRELNTHEMKMVSGGNGDGEPDPIDEIIVVGRRQNGDIWTRSITPDQLLMMGMSLEEALGWIPSQFGLIEGSVQVSIAPQDNSDSTTNSDSGQNSTTEPISNFEILLLRERQNCESTAGMFDNCAPIDA